MKRRESLDRNEERDLAGAAADVIIDATRDDLWEALHSIGIEPAQLAGQSRAVARDVLARYAVRRTEATREEEEVRALHEGLGLLVQLLRRREQVSPDELATQARVEVDEVRKIESDPAYSPNPRTVYQLEQRFKLPPRTLVKLAGVTARRSAHFTDEVMKFAANAKTMGSLSRAEQKLLNAFVKFLVSEGDKESK